MPAAQMIVDYLSGRGRPGTVTPEVEEETNSEKNIAILLRCPLIAGLRPVAEAVARNGNLLCFRKGEILITQGAQDDYVDFIVAGEVDIIIRGRHRTTKACPETVGELSAEEPDKPRTATVKARSETVKTIRLEGTVFRKLLEDHPSIIERLAIASRKLARDRINDDVVPRSGNTFTWLTISVFIGAFCAIFCFWGLSLFGAQGSWKFFGSALAGMAGFAAMLTLNPRYFYRRMIYACILGAAANLAGIFFSFQHSLPDGTFKLAYDPTWSEAPSTQLGMLAFWAVLIIVFVLKDRSQLD